MKKSLKFLSSLFVALLMALNVLPAVSAQSTAGEVYAEINAANQTMLESMHANGFISTLIYLIMLILVLAWNLMGKLFQHS